MDTIKNGLLAKGVRINGKQVFKKFTKTELYAGEEI